MTAASIATGFSMIKQFNVTVPHDYDHDKQVDSFASRVLGMVSTLKVDDFLTSRNFANASVVLARGKTYNVNIFEIPEGVTGVDCIMFVRHKKDMLFAGAQGLTLAWDKMSHEFPNEKRLFGLDEECALWNDGDARPMLPAAIRAGGDQAFLLMSAEQPLNSRDCFLCFSEV